MRPYGTATDDHGNYILFTQRSYFMNFPVNPARMALINCTLQNRFVEVPNYNRLALLERINHFCAKF